MFLSKGNRNRGKTKNRRIYCRQLGGCTEPVGSNNGGTSTSPDVGKREEKNEILINPKTEKGEGELEKEEILPTPMLRKNSRLLPIIIFIICLISH